MLGGLLCPDHLLLLLGPSVGLLLSILLLRGRLSLGILGIHSGSSSMSHSPVVGWPSHLVLCPIHLGMSLGLVLVASRLETDYL